MTESPVRYRIALGVAMAAIIVALGAVLWRADNPEWKTWQRRGISLCITDIERQIADAEPDRRKKLSARLASLKKKTPAIIEIRPFDGKLPTERCLTCHFGIEDISQSHPTDVFGCVICHGGNGADLTVEGAHIGLRGGSNPARLDLAPISCGTKHPELGACHSEREHKLLNRTANVPTSLMATNAGIISIMRFQWGVKENSIPEYAIRDVRDRHTEWKRIPDEHRENGSLSLPASHFRKFCAVCHLWESRHIPEMGRLQGCPACHAPYGPEGKYEGCDPTVPRDEPGHARRHTLTNKVPDDRCRACHNRSARTGMNYHGEMESAQYGTPYVRGGMSNNRLGDERFYLRLTPDIHHEKGMACIDCHTGQDTMGDGRLYAHMEDQVEIRCEDCHGTYDRPPKSMVVRTDDPLTQTLMRTSTTGVLPEGTHILTTSKGRPIPNVTFGPKGWVLTSKVTGKQHPVTVITGNKKAHRIRGHHRLECDTCHSAWSPQCFGCHQVLDLRHKGTDHLTRLQTPGRWAEGRSYFRFFRNILGINSRGRVGILVPGCQVWNTVVSGTGSIVGSYDSKVMPLKNGMTSMAMGPTHPHTTRTEAPRCVDCHLSPKAAGLGEGRLRKLSPDQLLQISSVFRSKAAGLKIDYPLDAATSPAGNALQSTSHRRSRPFNAAEIERIVDIARCLPCHDRYDDPVWERTGPYVETEKCLEAAGRL